jgi:O-antigen ligase
MTYSHGYLTPGVPRPAPAGALSAGARGVAAAPAVAAERSVSSLAKWAVGFAIFLSISRMHQFILPLGIIRAPFLSLLFATVVLLGETNRWKPNHALKHWIWKGIGVLVVIAVVGAPFGIFPGRSVSFLIDFYSRTIWIAILTYAVARTTQGARFIARTFMFAGIAAVLLALKIGRIDNAGRLAGGFSYDPNDIALVANVTLPLVYWYCVDKANKFRWLVALSLIPLLMVIIRSGSRGGFLGLAAVVAGMIFLGFHRVSPRLRRTSIVVATLAIASFPLLPGSYRERVATIFGEEDYNMTSSSGRWEVWKRGLRYAITHPLTGVGIDNFRTAEGKLSGLAEERQREGRGLKWSAAHNSFVQVFAELGLIAGMAFVVLIFKSTWHLMVKIGKATRAQGPNADLLGPLLGVSMLAFAVSGFFLSFAYYDIAYILLALASAILLRMLGMPSRRGRRAGSAAPFAPTPRYPVVRPS